LDVLNIRCDFVNDDNAHLGADSSSSNNNNICNEGTNTHDSSDSGMQKNATDTANQTIKQNNKRKQTEPSTDVTTSAVQPKQMVIVVEIEDWSHKYK
jgi:hypothetical protein